MRLQQSRSAAVIANAGMTHAIIGIASRTSDSSETPTLPTGFISLRKYRFDQRLDAIPRRKLEVTDGRLGLARSTPPSLALEPAPRENCSSRGINGLAKARPKTWRSSWCRSDEGN